MKKVYLGLFLLLFCFFSSAQAQVEKIINGNFEKGLDSWGLQVQGTAAATMDIDSLTAISGKKSVHIKVTAAGSNAWDIQLNQNVNIAKDKKYFVKMKYKATVAIPTTVWIQKNGGSYDIYYNKTLNLATTTTSLVDSIVNYTTDSCKININFGNIGLLEAWVDDISVTEVDAPPPPVTSDTCLVNTVGAEKIVNGGFESGDGPWFLELYNGAKAKYSVDKTAPMRQTASGLIKVDSSTGTAYHVQLREVFGVLKGRKYYVAFQARASQNCTIEASIQQNHDPYTTVINKKCDLKTTPQVFFDSTGVIDADDKNMKFNFMVGASGNVSVWVDRVTIIEYTKVENLNIAMDAKKDAFYNSLKNPEDGLIYIPSQAYLRDLATPPKGPRDNKDLSAKIWMAWDNNYMYYYAEVTDDIISCDNATNWSNDKIELKYDPDPSIIGTSGAIQVGMSAQDKSDAINAGAVDNLDADKNLLDVSGNTWVPTTKDYARVETLDGYILEWRIPIPYINTKTRFIKAGVGSKIGLAINVADNDGIERSKMIQWSAGFHNNVWSNPQLHGTVYFMPDNKVKCIAQSSQDTTIKNDSSKIWYYGALSSVEPERLSTYPRSFSLSQNYPNPFNPSTVIKYSLDKADNVSITVYNVTGQVVRNLVSEKIHKAGEYKVSWDAKNDQGFSVPSGVYFYQIRQGTNVETKKMVLLR